MKFKEGDKVRIKSLDEIDKDDPNLNTSLIEKFENLEGEITEIERDGEIELSFPGKAGFTVSPEHVNLILKKDSHLPKELFEI